jgi:hypothetical protein
MTDTTIVAARGMSAAAKKRLFSLSLLAATLLPVLAVATYYGHSSASFGIALLGAIASTHVVATLYLLTDPDVRSYIKDRPVKMGLIPAALAAAFAAALTMPGSALFILAALAVTIYQTWHFGAQNIGVSSFVSFCERSRPLDQWEKRAIRVGIFSGMLGVLYVAPSTFGWSAEKMGIPETGRHAIANLYVAGQFAAFGVAAVALWFAGRSVLRGHHMTAVALLSSIGFFLPLYLSSDFLFAVGMYSTAHGLQYIVFLSGHSLSPNAPLRSGTKLGFLIAPAALLLVVLAAHIFRPQVLEVSTDSLPLLGSILMGVLTLTHFWVDQYLWRMRERGKWLKERYAFVFAKD